MSKLKVSDFSNRALSRPPALKQPTKANDHNTTGTQNAEPKQNQGRTLGGELQKQKGSVQRITVRIVGYRVRPLDPDNFAGSCKELLDGLRHAHLIDGDEAWRIRFETEQEKVSHYKDEKTVIELPPAIDAEKETGR